MILLSFESERHIFARPDTGLTHLATVGVRTTSPHLACRVYDGPARQVTS